MYNSGPKERCPSRSHMSAASHMSALVNAGAVNRYFPCTVRLVTHTGYRPGTLQYLLRWECFSMSWNRKMVSWGPT